MLHLIIYATLGQLATGILLFIAIVPPSQIGQSFSRFHIALALVFWILAVHWKFSIEVQVLAALMILALIFTFRESIYYSFLALSFLVSLFLVSEPSASTLGVAAALSTNLPSILVLGGSSVAMLLGHWYLVAPGLSIKYLKIVTIALIAALVIRSGILIYTVMSNSGMLNDTSFYLVYGLFFWQRVLLGLFLTLVLSVLTYYCVRIRSTQSATGILYVVVVFCLVGEIIGTYLFIKTGLPF